MTDIGGVARLKKHQDTSVNISLNNILSADVGIFALSIRRFAKEDTS